MTFLLLWLISSVLTSLHILNRAREPAIMLSWILAACFIPIVGCVLYFLFGARRRFPRLNLNRRRKWHDQRLKEPPVIQPGIDRLFSYEKSKCNTFEMYPDGSAAMDAIRTHIRSAKHFILVEYYIIASDRVTHRITEELIAATKRGVEVFVMYDAHGSGLFFSGGSFFEKLRKKGLLVGAFLPLSYFLRMYDLNHRNHRKLMIIDGTTAFSGGRNLSSEYLGRWHKKQQHDYTFKVDGPICRQLIDIFSIDWRFATGKNLALKAAQSQELNKAAGNVEIQIVNSGPDQRIPLFYNILLQQLTNAKKTVCAITPYFVPDYGVCQALMAAARRGVDVKLILPSKIDWMSVLKASHSYLDDLLLAGVKIYKYAPVLLHAKMLIVDEEQLLLGSSNLDIRSFRLNFELDFLVDDPDTVHKAVVVFEKELERSQYLEPKTFLRRPFTTRVVENFCRLFSPII